MAFKMEAADAVATLVEAALPRFSGEKKLLYVLLDVEVTREESSEFGPRRFVHFPFRRPGNYTTVMMTVTNSILLRKEEIVDWEVTSCHDSCWRGDGLLSPLSKLYFEMCEEVDPAARPKDLWATVQFSSLHAAKIVEVKNFVHDRKNFIAHIEW